VTPPRRSFTDSLQEWGLVTLAIAAVTIAATWPLAKSSWLVPAHQDPLFSSWRLYQWARNLSGQWPGGLFDGNIFAPGRDVLLYSDAIPLLAVPAAPFLWLGVPVLKVYATLFWLSFLGAGLAMYACARELTGSRFGGFVAAVIFTAAPSRIEHVMHLELLWSAWLPLVVLGTVRLLRGRAGGGRLAGGALAAQFLSCIYYGVFMITLWPLLAGLEWVRTRPPLPRRLIVTAAAWMLAAVVVAGAYAIPYQRARAVVGDREDFEIEKYGAMIESYLVYPPSNRLLGWTAAPDDSELRLAPGLIASGLAVSALLTPSAPWTLALTATGLVAMDASLGSHGWTYPVLRHLLPPYRGLRVPARFGAIVLLCVSLLAAIGAANLARHLGHARFAAHAALALLVVMGVEYANVIVVRGMPRRSPPVYHWLASLPGTVIVHAPLPQPHSLPGVDVDFQFFAQYHRHRLLNGNSGFYPPGYMGTIERCADFPDRRCLNALRVAGADYLLVHAQHFPSPRAFADAVLTLESRPDVTPVMTSDDNGGVVRIYRLERDR
jgi:hypothetical protein